jgi:hypothetical protein
MDTETGMAFELVFELLQVLEDRLRNRLYNEGSVVAARANCQSNLYARDQVILKLTAQGKH